MCKWIFVLVGRSSVLWNPLILERGWRLYWCGMCCWCCVEFKDNEKTISCRLFSHFCFGLFEKWICCGLRNIYCGVHHDICVWSLFLPFDCSCCFRPITNIFRFFEILLSSLRVIPVHLGFPTPFCSLFVYSFPLHPQLNNVRLLDKTIKKKLGLSILITVNIRSSLEYRAVLPWHPSLISLVTISISPTKPIAFFGFLGFSDSCSLKPFPVGIPLLFHCRRVFLAGGSPAPRQFHSSPAVRGGVQSVSLGIIVA